MCFRCQSNNTFPVSKQSNFDISVLNLGFPFEFSKNTNVFVFHPVAKDFKYYDTNDFNKLKFNKNS